MKSAFKIPSMSPNPEPWGTDEAQKVTMLANVIQPLEMEPGLEPGLWASRPLLTLHLHGLSRQASPEQRQVNSGPEDPRFLQGRG